MIKVGKEGRGELRKSFGKEGMEWSVGKRRRRKRWRGEEGSEGKGEKRGERVKRERKGRRGKFEFVDAKGKVYLVCGNGGSLRHFYDIALGSIKHWFYMIKLINDMFKATTTQGLKGPVHTEMRNVFRSVNRNTKEILEKNCE